MSIYSVYLITNLVNDKKYVGFTSNIERRWKYHRWSGKNLLGKAIRKYGVENFIFEVIYQSFDRQHCLEFSEPHFISEHDCLAPKGYNICKGGKGTEGRFHTDESKALMSKKRKGHKMSDETRKRMSESHKGKPLSESHRIAAAKAQLGRIPSSEQRKKLSEAMKRYHANKINKC